ncbi:death domain-containing protein 1 [Sphaeramia orbicularis]|uniref:death domain-containing protein 1 n=1 Tax=Sphaeramia orbicularis TaxID=375764 RepID=UPI00117DE4AE|nr:death domain-containing protein 1 [Sphaeramia orbicularis]
MGLSAQADGGGARPLVSDVCFVRAPPGVHRALVCEAVDALSFLMVGGAEELLSGVVRVGLRPGAVFPFPVAVAVPFSARYRGNYREVVVKVVDAERRVNYIHPVVTEGNCDGQRSSLAEVRVYALGLFAVVSRLKKETFTVPRTGSSFKLTTDPRVGLTYLPQSFTAPVMIQASVQPLDAVLLASVRSRTEVYHPVVSTSPMLYLTHPTSQPLRRTMTLTLPCPPNPTKKRAGPVEELKTRSVGGSLSWDHHVNNRLRALDRHVKASAEVSMDLLMVLVYRDKEWSLMEDVNVKNQQKGLVSMELTENIHRVLVLRLQSPVQPCHLLSLAEDLEDTARRHAVTVILQRQKDDPRAVLVSALPSRDLEWEVSRLRAQGYAGAVDASHEVSMCEGDQLILRFSGNITSTGKGEEVFGIISKLHLVSAPGSNQNQNQNLVPERLTFHSQRRNQIRVRLTQVDPFGNHSSQHYKGTAMFYKVSRAHVDRTRDQLTDQEVLGEPSSPFLSTQSSPFLSTQSSPFLSTQSSPFLSTQSSLFLSTQSSPFLSTQSGPFLSTQSGPFLSTQSGPFLSTQSSLFLSTQSSPFLSTQSGPFLSTQSSLFLSTQSSPFLSTQSSPFLSSPFLSTQSSPFLSTQSSLFLSTQSSPFLSTQSGPFLSTQSVRSLLDSVLLWLSTRLSQEDVSLLVLSLRLRRSTVQLVQLRAGGSPASRAFQVLALWRRGLPTAPPPHRNLSHLASCLAKSGRPDLGQELLDRLASGPDPGPDPGPEPGPDPGPDPRPDPEPAS